ncbi:MAG: gliding motility-associated ABC transporter permease subunit GldF [Bacteroidetes bacterium]|nr:gliding motility-associated ABC transporter permease subunit GldF [Bacteroidota bacterium]
MLNLFRKEINSFFNSLIAYIAISVFLIITSLFLWVFPLNYNIIQSGYANLDSLFQIGPYVFLFLIPAITMRFFSDEKKSGTIEMLLTKPLSDINIIMAKYLAGITLVLLSLIPTLIYFLTVYMFAAPHGNIDIGGIIGSYLGLLMLGAGFVAIGVFSSAITENQIISFIIAVFLCAMAFIGFEMLSSFEMFGSFDLFIKNLGMYSHYSSMGRGVIDSRDVIYFLSVITIFILFTKIKLESRKW